MPEGHARPTRGVIVDEQVTITTIKPRDFSPNRHLFVAFDGWFTRAYEISQVDQTGGLYAFRLADGTTRSAYANANIEVIEK